MEFDKCRVDKKILNRVKDEDVLICNLRKALPRIILKEIFENIIRRLDKEDESLIKKYYKNCITNNHDYFLCSVPLFLDNRYLDEINITEDNLKFILEWYEKFQNGYKLNVDKYIDENTEYLLLLILKKPQLWINESERTKLSMILEKCSFINSAQIYYCQMVVNTKHPYFYHKAYEHIPGMMLIEAGRQACYPYAFKYLGYKNEDIVLSFSKLNVEFISFVQSNFSVNLIINPESEDTYNKTGVQRICFNVNIFQMGKLVCKLKFNIAAIKREIFNEIRSEIIEKKDICFIPKENFCNEIILLGSNKEEYTNLLKKVSLNSLEIVCNSKLKEYEEYDFILYVKTLGFIFGKCKLVTQTLINENEYSIKMLIVNISQKDIGRLDKAIKMYSYIENEDSILFQNSFDKMQR